MSGRQTQKSSSTRMAFAPTPRPLADDEMNAAAGGLMAVGGWSRYLGNGYFVIGVHDEGTRSSHYAIVRRGSI